MTAAAATVQDPSLLRVVLYTVFRGVNRLKRRPSILVPSVVMPVFFVITFSSSFGGIARDPAFGTDNAFNWMTAYGVLQGAAFAGTGAAGMTAEDLENGFFDRLLLAPGSRSALLLGPLAFAAIRAVMPAILVPVAATIVGGLDMPGGVLATFGMALLGAVGTAIVFGLLSLAAVFVMKSQKALLVSSLFVFSSLFMSTGQAPLDFQVGWLQWVARRNPITPVIDLTRQGFIGDVTWAGTRPGLISLALMVAVLGALAHWLLSRLAP
ncbi:MAG: ABC transporter permease [Acidimicrobiales bacterium]